MGVFSAPWSEPRSRVPCRVSCSLGDGPGGRSDSRGDLPDRRVVSGMYATMDGWIGRINSQPKESKSHQSHSFTFNRPSLHNHLTNASRPTAVHSRDKRIQVRTITTIKNSTHHAPWLRP